MKVEINGKTLYHIQVEAGIISQDAPYDVFAWASNEQEAKKLGEQELIDSGLEGYLEDYREYAEVYTVYAEGGVSHE